LNTEADITPILHSPIYLHTTKTYIVRIIAIAKRWKKGKKTKRLNRIKKISRHKTVFMISCDAN